MWLVQGPAVRLLAMTDVLSHGGNSSRLELYCQVIFWPGDILARCLSGQVIVWCLSGQVLVWLAESC